MARARVIRLIAGTFIQTGLAQTRVQSLVKELVRYEKG